MYYSNYDVQASTVVGFGIIDKLAEFIDTHYAL